MIYFLTKTYPPQNGGGGALLKSHTVDLLKKNGHDVKVICVGKKSQTTEDVIFVDNKDNIKFSLLKQRLGVQEDYLDTWVTDTFELIKNKITSKDIVFATCGGELANIKLAFKLKQKSNCRTLLHFHDPLDHTTLNLERLDYKYHVNRNSLLNKYCKNADIILTSTKTYARHLEQTLNREVFSVYFGVIDQNNTYLEDKRYSNNEHVNIIYGGSDGYAQRSSQIFEMLNNRATEMKNVNFHVFGSSKVVQRKFNVYNHGMLTRENYLKQLIMPNMLGYVSLGPKYFRNCIPSKIYELVSQNIPILGVLPYGEAFEFIRDQGLGFTVVPGDSAALIKSIERMKDPFNYNRVLLNLEKFKPQLSPKIYEKYLISLLEKII